MFQLIEHPAGESSQVRSEFTDGETTFGISEEVAFDTFFGSSYKGPSGCIAHRGVSQYHHRFGGASWRVIDPNPEFGGPILVLTLGLRDPLLAGLRTGGLEELPLCSYLGCDIWHYPQFYEIHPEDRHVLLVARKEPAEELYCSDYEQGLLASSLCLHPMTAGDFPTTEDRYWNASEEFTGGSRFIRVFGPPLWLENVTTVTCKCGKTMTYVCSIGYESQVEGAIPSGLLPGNGVFFGEAATYWFLCPLCRIVGVVIQST